MSSAADQFCCGLRENEPRVVLPVRDSQPRIAASPGGCQVQLGLPFAERVPEPVSYVWLLACESRFEEAVATRFRQRTHAIVDGRDGRPVVLPQDVILLHRSGGSFLAFGPVGVDGGSVLESIRRLIFISRNVVAREHTCDVIGLFLGDGGISNWTPPTMSTPLERALATLRHNSTRDLPEIREQRCRAILELLPGDADPLLVALVELERIDARWLAQSGADRREYLEWTDRFSQLGATRMARRPHRVFRQTSKLPDLFGESAKEQPSWYRAGYRAVPMLAQRLTVNEPMRGTARGGGHRDELQMPAIPEAQLCAWIRGVPSAKLQPMVSTRPLGTSLIDFEVRAVLDSELAVRLGIPGKAGIKDGICELRAYSASCQVVPTRIERSIGEPGYFHVAARRPGNGAVDVEFHFSTGSPLVVRTSLSKSHVAA